MQITFCNGCNREIRKDEEYRNVAFTIATLPRDSGKPGLQTDQCVEGQLCPACIAIVNRFIGENDDVDAFLCLRDEKIVNVVE